MEIAKDQLTLASLAVGSRLLVRSRENWRFAAVSRITGTVVILTVASPTGYNYRLRRAADAEILCDGAVPVLMAEYKDNWHENFGRYDARW